MKKLPFVIALVLGLVFGGYAAAQPVPPGYYKGYYDALHQSRLGPTYPYTWGPYGNYGYNPYVGNAGYFYRAGTYYPGVYGYNSYGYQNYGSFYFQFGRFR